MCRKLKIISTTKSGQLTQSKNNGTFQLEFNNIYFELNQQQFENFKRYLSQIEIAYWEHKFSCSKFKRKIPLPTLQENLILMFNRHEIYELKKLFGLIDNAESLHIGDIDYELSLN
ncbi:MAG: DUF6686 family protein [Bacteroidota bacterium]